MGKNPFLIYELSSSERLFSFARRLNKDSVYAFRVHRSIGGDDINVGYSNDLVNVALLLDFASGGDCYITKVYDQRLRSDFVQPNPALMPLIVKNGSLVTTVDLSSMIPEVRFDHSDDYMESELQNSANYRFVFGSWSDCQEFDIRTEETGNTKLPSASSILGLNSSEFAYFPFGSTQDIYLMNLRSVFMSDHTENDLFRLRFLTSGAKALSVTESGSNISFTDKDGTQNTSYSKTTDVFDYLVVRSDNPSGITAIDWSSKELTGNLPQNGFGKLSGITSFKCSGNKLTGAIPYLYLNTSLETFHCNDNQLCGWSGWDIPATLGDFQAQNNALTQPAIDAILAGFVAANKPTGTRILNLGGTGNSAPSADGYTNKAILESSGWTVTTN